MSGDKVQRLSCDFGGVSYPYFLGTGCLDEFVAILEGLDADRYFLLCEEAVVGPIASPLRARLGEERALVLLHAPGESAKRLTLVESLIERLIRLGATRRSCVVAVGGGVTGNIAGMVAALAFRGIRLVHVPTTLLAMLDSVVSLKQAVNGSCGKNLIGTYYPPECVLADTAHLHSLPRRQITSALCEVIKNGLAIAPDHIGQLRQILGRGSLDDATYRGLIGLSIEAKSRVMNGDAKESTTGLVLEYGHTTGHAIEHASGGAVPHGEAVALGMLVAAAVSRELGLLSPAEVATHRELIELAGVTPVLPPEVRSRDVLQAVSFDNKRGYLRAREGSTLMVILERLGRPATSQGRPLIPVPLGVIEHALTSIDQREPQARCGG